MKLDQGNETEARRPGSEHDLHLAKQLLGMHIGTDTGLCCSPVKLADDSEQRMVLTSPSRHQPAHVGQVGEEDV